MLLRAKAQKRAPPWQPAAYLWELAYELGCGEEQRPGHGLRLLCWAVLVRAAALLAPRGPGDVAVAACASRLYLPAVVAASSVTAAVRNCWMVVSICSAAMVGAHDGPSSLATTVDACLHHRDFRSHSDA